MPLDEEHLIPQLASSPVLLIAGNSLDCDEKAQASYAIIEVNTLPG
jgi:hypothetical protein